MRKWTEDFPGRPPGRVAGGTDFAPLGHKSDCGQPALLLLSCLVLLSGLPGQRRWGDGWPTAWAPKRATASSPSVRPPEVSPSVPLSLASLGQSQRLSASIETVFHCHVPGEGRSQSRLVSLPGGTLLTCTKGCDHVKEQMCGPPQCL